MEKFTKKEKDLLLQFLKIELEKGGNQYTDVLLKLEKEVR